MATRTLAARAEGEVTFINAVNFANNSAGSVNRVAHTAAAIKANPIAV